ncbi:sulfotransferase domain-containing protein [Halothece sp. PCC 7418]|uniref:sulfotransferase domain-containing protein n=1 Tax=Halothece sp. (strain PCC 7418) TaxID=65093 RepID=UPI002101C5FB|nr:sulfotransferase domain-containing protein [Halothece sp. PCC 7418]
MYPDDTFLVSYPKSGNTWVRYLIGNYISNNQCNLTNHNLLVPDIHTQKNWDKIKRPRCIKSHKPFTNQYKKVIYLVRDGRSVAVSYYFHCLKFNQISQNMSFQEYLERFNDGSLDSYSTWSNHVFSWLDNAPEDFLLVRYEDLKADTSQEFSRILSFMKFPLQEEKLKQAIEASRMTNMKKVWNPENYSNLAEYNPHLAEALSKSSKDISFVRQGKVSEWKKFFDSATMEQFKKLHGEALKRLNYI